MISANMSEFVRSSCLQPLRKLRIRTRNQSIRGPTHPQMRLFVFRSPVVHIRGHHKPGRWKPSRKRSSFAGLSAATLLVKRYSH